MMDVKAMTDRVLERYAAETLDMIVAVFGNQLLGAKDALNRKFLKPEAWPAAKRGLSFELIRLRRVPFNVAERLVDVGTPASTFSNSRAAWAAAKRYADPKPFAQSR
jgi:hypothetical protein